MNDTIRVDLGTSAVSIGSTRSISVAVDLPEVGVRVGMLGGAGGVSKEYVDAGDAANSAETQSVSLALAAVDGSVQAVASDLGILEGALNDVRAWAGDPTPLHVNSTLSEWLSDIADEVHRLSARPAFSLDGILHVDMYNGFARVFSNDGSLESGEKWVEFELAVSPAPGGTVPPGTNAVASSAGVLVRANSTTGPVIGTTGGAVSQMALANYISQNRICRVMYDLSNPVRPTLTILETLDAVPVGSSALHIGALYDVSAPADTPAGKVLGTVAPGSWGPVDPPAPGPSPSDSNPQTVSLSGVQSPGTSPLYARADHRHVAYTSAPVALGAAAAMGSSTNFSRADHVHPVPAIGSLADVTAPAGTPAGQFLGTTGVGAWGAVANPVAAHEAASDPHPQYLPTAGGAVTGVLTVGAETASAPLGPELGTGSGLTQTVSTVVGQTYQVGGTGVTAITLDAVALAVSNGWSSFKATASSHVLVGTGGTVLSVQRITGTSAGALGIAGALEVRRRGTSMSIGASSQFTLTTGINNTAFGRIAQTFLTTGSGNTAVGSSAQRSVTTGSSNTAIGYMAQDVLTTGSSNTALGTSGQAALTTGSFNTAFGFATQVALTTGGSNTGVGNAAQYGLTTGSANTAVGRVAQYSITTGWYNTAIGYYAQYHASQVGTVRGTVAIGCDSTGVGAWTTADDTIVLGTARHTTILRGPLLDLEKAGSGIVLVAAGGGRWKVTVSDAGALVVAAA